MANGNFGGGTGVALSPYLVEDAADLNAVRDKASAYYLQTSDIDLSFYENWVPIVGFGGTYDGGGFSIKNMTTNTSVTPCGLFGTVVGCNISNIVLLSPRVYSSAHRVGALIGEFAGGTITVDNVKIVDADVTGLGTAGGFAGRYESTSGLHVSVTRCSVTGSVRGTGGSSVGGFMGYRNDNHTGSSMTIRNCYSDCAIFGDSSVGGFIGNNRDSSNSAMVSECYCAGTISGFDYIGGFCGFVQHYGSGKFKNCVSLISKITIPYGAPTNPTIGDFTAYPKGPEDLESCYSLDTMHVVVGG